MAFIIQQILFFVSIAIILFVPGYFLLLAVWGRCRIFSNLEKLVLAFGLSLVSVNFLLILIGRIGIKISALSVVLLVAFFCATCYGIYKRRYASKNSTSSFSAEAADQDDKSFSKNQTILIILILFLTVFIKTVYLSNTIFPTSTDLGHHMYWSKLVSETGKLPVYEERDIIEADGNYQISEPRPIADFIIGEHLIFAAINLLTGISFISYFPSLVLFLIHLLGLLALFILAQKLFADFKYGYNIAIFTLFLIGPLCAISSSQVKFVSGGVIGNTIGNLLIPLVLYFYLRALKEKSSAFLTIALFTTAGLFYVHHLSAFIFIYIFAFSFLLFAALNIKNIADYARHWLKLIASRSVIVFIILAVLFIILIYTPNYVSTNAVETAIGGPSKATRAGLTFSQLKFTAGEARMALGIAGLILVFAARTRKNYASAIIGGWAIALLLMSLKPQWLYLDIPSGRIANYVAFPLAILGALAFVQILIYAKNAEAKYFYLNSKIIFSLFFAVLVFSASSGFYDNSQSLAPETNSGEAVQTFHAADFSSKITDNNDVILKDHNYITADAWIKLFYMRGYNYPFSRGLFKRYEDDTKKREMCTLWMLSSSASADGQKCFAGTKTNFLIVSSKFDGPQFEKSKNFWKIYSGDEISLYYKNL